MKTIKTITRAGWSSWFVIFNEEYSLGFNQNQNMRCIDIPRGRCFVNGILPATFTEFSGAGQIGDAINFQKNYGLYGL